MQTISTALILALGVGATALFSVESEPSFDAMRDALTKVEAIQSAKFEQCLIWTGSTPSEAKAIMAEDAANARRIQQEIMGVSLDDLVKELEKSVN